MKNQVPFIYLSAWHLPAYVLHPAHLALCFAPPGSACVGCLSRSMTSAAPARASMTSLHTRTCHVASYRLPSKAAKWRSHAPAGATVIDVKPRYCLSTPAVGSEWRVYTYVSYQLMLSNLRPLHINDFEVAYVFVVFF